MYGPLYIAYNNLITDHSMLILSSQATGKTSGSGKVGTGVATMAITGNFAGAFDLTYDLEIDSVAGGTEIGEATFKWRNSESGVGVWEETGVLTRSTAYALSADGLGTGLSITHTGRTGEDFASGDSWQWFARATYGTERLLDRNRMTGWRSTGDSSENIVIDLGSAQTPTLVIIHDHNLTSGATVTIEAHTSDSWGSPSYSYEFTSITDPLYYYIPTTQNYRYWRLVFEDSSNPDGYISINNIFLGTYLALQATNASWGSSAQDGYMLQSNDSASGVYRRYSYAQQQRLSLQFGDTMSNDDIDSLIALQAALVDENTNIVKPCWFHLFSDVAVNLKLMDWQDLGEFSHDYFAYLLNSGVAMTLSEVVKV